MLPPAISKLRQSSVRRYICEIERARSVSWGAYAAKSLNLEQKLVLCHPGWLSNIEKHRAGLGLTAFGAEPSRGLCGAKSLWGYDCPLGEQTIESDHVFPKALGGPADGTNQIWLCRLHNRWKGSDLLPFPWEDGEPRWLSDQVARIGAVVPLSSLLVF
jgi:hypothetical protein